MFHGKRAFSVASVETAEELAEKLTNHSWCLCVGFRHGDLLFLNDSLSEDGAAEFAVVQEDTKVQIESITFGWCSEEEALAYIEKLVAHPGAVRMGAITNPIDESEDHHCALCA